MIWHDRNIKQCKAKFLDNDIIEVEIEEVTSTAPLYEKAI